MKTLEEQIKDLAITRGNVKSKVKFQGDFHKDLENIVDSLEKLVAEQVIKKYGVEYSEYGTHSMKVKIKDKQQMIEKLIACNFIFQQNDIKYGYVTPQFTVTAKSKKTKFYELERYSLEKSENILTDVMHQLLEIIEEFD